ncbi:MAG: GntP family permease [Candidatus Neomarinimicrobiota bacterium]
MWLISLLILCVLFIVFSTTKLKLHPFVSLLLAALAFGLLSGMPLSTINESIVDGFGTTIGYIGIVIVAGTIIGTFLQESGGAFAMANTILKVTGKKNVPMAMGIIGYVVSVPVFCDSGFVLLSPLNKALSKKAGITLAASAIALSLGLYATHTMVPPTPGPIAATAILNADIGQVILLGLMVSIPALVIGWLFAVKVGSRIDIDPEPDLSEADIQARISEAPSAPKAFLPIVLPIILIVLRSIADFPTKPFGEGSLQEVIGFVGHPVIALLVGVLIAFTLPRRFDKQMLSSSGWIGQALASGAIIILITGAGGAFGKILQNSGIADILGENLAGAKLGIWLPFFLAAAIKSAQGSSTVAIITAASLLAPLLEPLGFDSGLGKALTVVAIGAGSMVVSHANDSYFWIVTQLSNMDVKTGYRLQTVGTLVVGLAAAVIVWVISLVWTP